MTLPRSITRERSPNPSLVRGVGLAMAAGFVAAMLVLFVAAKVTNALWMVETNPWVLGRLLSAVPTFLVVEVLFLRRMRPTSLVGASQRAKFWVLAVTSSLFGLLATYVITMIVSVPIMGY